VVQISVESGAISEWHGQNRHGSQPYSHHTLRRHLNVLARRLDIRDAAGRLVDFNRTHRFRHTRATSLKRRGVASDATFRRLREAGGVMVSALPGFWCRGCLAAGHAAVSRVPVPSLRQMAGCGIRISCIR
jgi:hypothetical protein